VVLQLRSWANNPLTIKNKPVTKHKHEPRTELLFYKKKRQKPEAYTHPHAVPRLIPGAISGSPSSGVKVLYGQGESIFFYVKIYME
jgi:hypothetical protein